jgi:hypothetical protein
MKWFRMYVEIIDDPKMKQVSDRSFRVFNYLLALAAEADEDGVIPMSRDDIIWRLRISEKDLDTAVKQLSFLDIIEDSYPLKFLNWGKRQYKSDDVGVRVKRYRNKNVTLHETAPDTDTDTDTEKKKLLKEKVEFKNSLFHNIPDALISKWKVSCPGIDIRREIARAEAWVISNPKLKKSNWERFLTNWMVRAQDRARPEGGNNGNRTNAYRRYPGAERRDTELPADVQAIIDEVNARSSAKAAASTADGEE